MREKNILCCIAETLLQRGPSGEVFYSLVAQPVCDCLSEGMRGGLIRAWADDGAVLESPLKPPPSSSVQLKGKVQREITSTHFSSPKVADQDVFGVQSLVFMEANGKVCSATRSKNKNSLMRFQTPYDQTSGKTLNVAATANTRLIVSRTVSETT